MAIDKNGNVIKKEHIPKRLEAIEKEMIILALQTKLSILAPKGVNERIKQLIEKVKKL